MKKIESNNFVKQPIEKEKEKETRRNYDSYEDINTFEGPYNDSLDIHVHRFDKKIQDSLICTICNKKIENIKISTTSKTNIYELDNRYLNEHLKLLKITNDNKNDQKEMIGYCYNTI